MMKNIHFGALLVGIIVYIVAAVVTGAVMLHLLPWIWTITGGGTDLKSYVEVVEHLRNTWTPLAYIPDVVREVFCFAAGTWAATRMMKSHFFLNTGILLGFIITAMVVTAMQYKKTLTEPVFVLVTLVFAVLVSLLIARSARKRGHV